MTHTTTRAAAVQSIARVGRVLPVMFAAMAVRTCRKSNAYTTGIFLQTILKP